MRMGMVAGLVYLEMALFGGLVDGLVIKTSDLTQLEMSVVKVIAGDVLFDFDFVVADIVRMRK